MKKNDKILNMLLPNALYVKAKEAAEARNISTAALIRLALTEWLDGSKDTGNILNVGVVGLSVDDIFSSLPCALQEEIK